MIVRFKCIIKLRGSGEIRAFSDLRSISWTSARVILVDVNDHSEKYLISEIDSLQVWREYNGEEKD